MVPAPGFLSRLKEWCEDSGALFVADEIQTGFCRTGDWFASEHEDVVPDLVTMAKGLAGGLPLSAVTGRAEVMDAVPPGGLGGTYAGNPVACSAALAAIETMVEDDLCARARHLGDVFLGRLTELQKRHPVIGDVRGRGGMVAVELVRPGTAEPAPDVTAAVARACHERGLLVLTCGTDNNVIRFLPPLVIDDDQLGDGLAQLEEAFAAVT